MRRVQLGISFAALLLLSCRAPFDPTDYNPDWTDASHGLAAPNYNVVIPEDNVNRIDIYLTGAGWAAVRKNMTDLWGYDFGAGSQPCCAPYPADPDYVDVEVRFNGKTWKHVGFRLKGNSTLRYAWQLGNYKFPFRLKFDEFDEAFPETWNQRFYGFRDLSFSGNVTDEPQLRERLATDLFRAAGVAAPRTAFYRVYIDFGNGLEYNGLYTMIELPEDAMLENQFGESRGNVYKPESHLSQFVVSEFARQNNQDSQDFSDVQALIAAVTNTSLQATNPAQWRANLEAAFNVDGFLNWLAVNNAIASWDTYGAIAHNYYLYNHSVKKLTWIPWDQDVAFRDNPGVIGAIPRGGWAFSLTMNEIDGTWPLIRHVVDDPVYFARYRTFLKAFYDNAFAQAAVDARIDKYAAMILPNIIGPNGEIPGHGYGYVTTADQYTNAVETIRANIRSRRAVIAQFYP